MSDVVVTLPRTFRWESNAPGLASWLAEGDAAGEPESGTLYGFSIGVNRPKIAPGERVYVVHRDRLIGYAPLVRLDQHFSGRWSLIRGGGAAAVTINEAVPGFRGFRYRWWDRSVERPFPEWHELARRAVPAC